VKVKHYNYRPQANSGIDLWRVISLKINTQ